MSNCLRSLVYVAVSRAQDRLILSGAFRASDLEAPEEPKPGHSALKLLLPALGGPTVDGDTRAHIQNGYPIEGDG